MRCARSIETTTRDSEISLTVLVLGTSTSMPDCRIGAVIMKITRSTSMTSTKGTMLISEREVPVWRASCGIFVFFQLRVARPLYADKSKREKKLLTQRTQSSQRRIIYFTPHMISHLLFSVSSVLKNFACAFTFFETSPAVAWIHFFDHRCDFKRETIHSRTDIPDVVQKNVIGDESGNGRKEARCCRNQRLGDARGHCPEACGPGRAQSRECVHDPPHRAEQSDERSDRRGRRQPRHIFFQPTDFVTAGQLHAHGHGVEAGNFAGRVSGADLAFDLAKTGAIHRFERRTAPAHLPRIGKSPIGAEDAKKQGRLAIDAREHAHFLKDERPGKKRKGQKHRQNDACNPAGLLDERVQLAGVQQKRG